MRMVKTYQARTRLSALIIDDEPVFRKLLADMIRGMEGFEAEIREAGEGSEAIQILRADSTYSPHLVITDFQMEPMNGVQFTRLLRTGEGGVDRFLPVVMVTGDHSHEVIVGAVMAGIDNIIHKPVRPSVLHDRVRHVLTTDASFLEVPHPVDPYFGPAHKHVRQTLLSPGRQHCLHHRPRRLH